MKRWIVIIILAVGLSFSLTQAFAKRSSGSVGSQALFTKDAHGHWEKSGNAMKDPDHDGVPNYLDKNNRNPNVQ